MSGVVVAISQGNSAVSKGVVIDLGAAWEPSDIRAEPVPLEDSLPKSKELTVYRNIDPAFMRNAITKISFTPSFMISSAEPQYEIVRTAVPGDSEDIAGRLNPTQTEGWSFFKRENFEEFLRKDTHYLSCMFVKAYEEIKAEEEGEEPSYRDYWQVSFFWINESDNEMTRLGALTDFQDIGALRAIMEQYFDMDDFPLQDLFDTIAIATSRKFKNDPPDAVRSFPPVVKVPDWFLNGDLDYQC